MCNLKSEQLENIIQKAKDHKANVTHLTDNMFDALYYLDKMHPDDLHLNHKDSIKIYQEIYGAKLDECMTYIMAEEQRSYADSIGCLFTLRNHIEERYKTEIINSKSKAISGLNYNNTKSEA